MFWLRFTAPATWGGCGGGCGMLTLTIKVFTPALPVTVTVLTTVPNLPARLTETSMAPFVPGARCHGCGGVFASVQPQEVRTLSITTSKGETFVRLKVKLAVGSPVLALYSLLSASHANEVAGSVGALTVAGVACRLCCVGSVKSTGGLKGGCGLSGAGAKG